MSTIPFDEMKSYLARRPGDHARFDANQELDVAVMHFDDESAKGQVALVRSGYGPELWVDGVCVALIDLYYRAPGFDGDHHPDDAGKLHIQIEDPQNDDPLGHVYIHPRYIDFMVERERGVQSLDDAGRWPTLRWMRPADRPNPSETMHETNPYARDEFDPEAP